MTEYNRVYAKIDLDAVKFNLQSIQQKLKGAAKIIAVVKTDGYGHGAAEIAKEIEAEDAVFGFATATSEEAFSLRNHGIKKPILILGYTFAADYAKIADLGIRPTVDSYAMAKSYSKAAQSSGNTVSIHIKIDTGMSRIGYQVTEEAADEIADIQKLPGIKIEGVFTHFARADETDKTSACAQVQLFQQMISMLSVRGVEIPCKHCSNSAAIAELPQFYMDLVRAGIILYGLWPSEEVRKDSIALKPVMELKSKIIHIKTLPAGRCVSYGGTYCLKEPRRIATIPVGYGDGYPRSLSGKGCVLIHGKKAPILGRVCMDQFMVDVTDIPDAAMLDTVTLVGKDGDLSISIEDLAKASGRFNYEFACDISKRIPRVFYKNNVPVFVRDYFQD